MYINKAVLKKDKELGFFASLRDVDVDEIIKEMATMEESGAESSGNHPAKGASTRLDAMAHAGLVSKVCFIGQT